MIGPIVFVSVILCLVIISGICAWFLDAPIYNSKLIYNLSKKGLLKILPQHPGVLRLCFVLSIVLSAIAFIEIPRSSGIGQIVCGRYSCYIFGEPGVLTTIAVFCAPFIIAKIIEFIVAGFRK